jgi:protocatechuate 3,4-dioxygenase beta subunit
MPHDSILPNLSSDHASLAQTLDVLQQRRRLLRALAGLGSVALLPPLRAAACTLIPAETAGPYPGDGTNGPNALTQSGIVRSDIRSSFGSSGSSAASGTLNTIRLRLVSTTSSACGLVQGLAVYLWHCDATGGYSMYSSGVTGQNYLRGVQQTDANGEVVFTSIFPGCYSGRWPHIHFEIYAALADATTGTNALRVSQLALPQSSCSTVYAQSALYPGSASNLGQISLASDNVFGDDSAAYQLATVTGDNTNGYETTLEVGVNVDATSDMIFEGTFES